MKAQRSTRPRRVNISDTSCAKRPRTQLMAGPVAFAGDTFLGKNQPRSAFQSHALNVRERNLAGPVAFATGDTFLGKPGAKRVSSSQPAHLFADRTSAQTMRANQLCLWFASLVNFERYRRRAALERKRAQGGPRSPYDPFMHQPNHSATAQSATLFRDRTTHMAG